jgi:cytochrome c5
MKRLNKLIPILLLASQAVSVSGDDATEPNGKRASEVLPESVRQQGKAIVAATCTACHSQMVVDNAAKSRPAWKKTLKKMADQGMPALPPQFEPLILDYLTATQGPKTGHDRVNEGPWGDRRNANPLW